MSRFQMLGKLGEGGMGIVFEAHDRERNMRVALKTLRHLDAGSLYRFKREFRALANLSHPNIVALYELISHRGSWFFTMEVVRGLQLMDYLHHGTDYEFGGETTNSSSLATTSDSLDAVTRALLAQHVRATARAPNGRAATRSDAIETGLAQSRPDVGELIDLERLRVALAQIGSALHALHTASLIHRDLKPANVRVTSDDRVVLMDFGVVARALRGRAVAPGGSRIGTPGYMAPEQVDRQPLTPAADWYAFGVILFEALTGQLPFTGTLTEVLAAKSAVPAPRPSELARGVPDVLDDLTVNLLARNPEHRPDGLDVLRQLGAAGAARLRRRSTMTRRRAQLVGRRAQLDELWRLYREVRDGVARCGVIFGPAGMGKSHLCDSFLTQVATDAAGTRQPVVLAGICHERERMAHNALDGVIDDLTQFLRGLPQATRTALIPEDFEYLAQLFPVLLRVPHVPVAETVGGASRPADRARARTALRALLAAMGGHRPIIIHLDNTQWADADSLDLLSALIEPEPVPGVLLLLCVRTHGLGDERGDERIGRLPPAVRDRLAGAWDQSWLARLAIGPLDGEESRDLVRVLIDDAERVAQVADSALSDCAGHPLLVCELARYLDDVYEQRLDKSVTLKEVMAVSVAELDDEVRAMLEVLAVAGQPVLLPVAADACQLRTDDVHRVWRALCTSNLAIVADIDGGVWLDCSCEQVRAAVIGGLSAQRQRALHRGLAQALVTRQDASVAMVAGHFAAADVPEQAVRHLIRSAHKAVEALEIVRATELYRQAESFLGDDTQEVELVHLRCHVHLGLARCHYMIEDVESAQGQLASAEKLATEHELVSELADIYYWRGCLHGMGADNDACMAAHERAREYARRSGSPANQVRSLSGIADALYLRGQMSSAYERYANCVELCRKHGLSALEAANVAMLGWMRFFHCNLDAALGDCRAAVAAAEVIGGARVGLLTRCGALGHILLEAGEFDEARREFDAGLSLARSVGARRFAVQALTGLAVVASHMGEMRSAVLTAERAVSVARDRGMAYSGPWALAGLALVCREPERCLQLLIEGEALLKRANISHNHLYFRRLAIDVCLRLARYDEAERHALALYDYGRTESLPWSQFFVARARALIARARGQGDDATLEVLHRHAQAQGFVVAAQALNRP